MLLCERSVGRYHTVMRRPIILVVAMLIVVIVMAVVFVNVFPTLVTHAPAPQPDAPTDAQSIEANNRGVGLMGRYEYENARQVFAELVEQHPDWLQARINLAIATLNRQRDGDEPAALDILDEVLAIEPDHLQAQYVSGLLRLYLDEPDRAMEHFRFVAQRDADDPYAAYYVAQSYAQRGEHEEALQWYRNALEVDPYLRSAYYGKFQALQRLGRQDEAVEFLEMFQRLDGNPRARLVDFVYTRMGPKGEAIAVGVEHPVVADLPQGRVFQAPRPLQTINEETVHFDWGRREGAALPVIHVVDIDGDGELDLFLSNGLRDPGANTHHAVLFGVGDGTFRLDWQHPLSQIEHVNAVAWGDVDNSGRVDAYLLRAGENQLWMQDEAGQWRDVTSEANLSRGADGNSIHGMMFDADHDGDLDIFIINSDAPNELQNNNFDGTFQPLASEHGLAGDEEGGVQIIAADLEGDRDLDLIVLNRDVPHEVYVNDRLWRYTAAKGFDAFMNTPTAAVVAGDVDADGRTELYALHADDGTVLRWTSDADGQWASEVIVQRPELQGGAGGRLALVDVTGDGVAEVLVSAGNTLKVVGLQQRVGEVIETIDLPVANVWAYGNFDARGPWLVTIDEAGLPMLHEPGPGRLNFALVSFTGKEDAGQSMRSNASGIGTYYAARIGSRWVAGHTLGNDSGPGQSLQPVAIGLGGAERIDFLHIDWPDGVFQSELDLAAAQHHVIPETQRQLSSCPVLWAWDGEKYEFVSDVLGVGGIGFLAGGPGEYAPSRPWERFMFPLDFLQPKDGRYHIKLGEPMEEACYLDSAILVVYDLPPGWSMTLDERMHIGGPAPTGESRFYRESMVPKQAVNDRGQNVTAVVQEANLQAAPVGEVDLRFIGRLKRDNVVTLTFPQPIDSRDGQPLLIADGWIEYPYSQTVFSAWQAGAGYRAPTIEARGNDGQWHIVLEQFGYPAGMPRQMSVPLEGLPEGTRQLRISTNQEIFWDRLMIAWAEDAPDEMQRQTLDLASARLWRSGFARRADLPQRLPYYDYADRVPLWDTRHQAGWYTRFGPVEKLIRHANQALAIFGPGEEIHMEFSVPDAPVSDGWTRVHVLETTGWCKDMDLFTRDGETLEPLPGEQTPERLELHERFNTRYESGR